MAISVGQMRPDQREEVTQDRLLDAAFDCVVRFGLARTTMGDVAEAAGVSRQTVYRYFPTKKALLASLVLREDARMIAAIRDAAACHAEARVAIEAGIVTCLAWLRDHPLLARVLRDEPGELLPYLTVDAHPLLAVGRRAAEEIFGERVPGGDAARISRAAELLARAMQSYAITPPAEAPAEIAASLADLFCAALGVEPGR